MADDDGSQPLVSYIWNTLISGVTYKRKASLATLDNAESASAAVERQTENLYKCGTIWEAALNANAESFKKLISENPKAVDERGPVGECPIHMLFLYGSDAHLNMAKDLIKSFPHTIIQIYEEPEYYGEMVLHIAIIKQNAAMVDWLLSDEHDVAYREKQLTSAARGNFFKVGRPCYYGETPLAFACCTNQWNIVEILLDYGASMDAVDSNANNVLHLLVIHKLPEMYTKFKERWIEEQELKRQQQEEEEEEDDAYMQSEKNEILPLWKRLNKDGFTPLTLAAKLGLFEMFSFLLEERKITQWSFGPVSCVLYPLDQVDLEFHEENLEKSIGALEIIVQNAHVDLITHPRMIDLVDKKWERFARRIFFRRFLQTLFYLCVFLITTILDQTRLETTEGKDEDAVITSIEAPGFIHQSICTVGRLFVLAGALYKGRNESSELLKLGFRKYFQTTGSGLLENCLSCLFCLTIVLVNIFRMLDSNIETALLAMAAIFGWGYMLFFLMAFRVTGPFVVMIYQMLFNDVLRFCIIYVVFLIGFSQAFFILFYYNGFGGFFLSVKQSFLGLLGDFDLDTYVEAKFSFLSVFLLIFYIIVVTILLLNLLVAMMGDTYGKIIDDATKVWHLERARIVFAIENEMETDERNLESNKYWTNVKGERYLQVEEIKGDTYLTKKSGGDDDADDDG